MIGVAAVTAAVAAYDRRVRDRRTAAERTRRSDGEYRGARAQSVGLDVAECARELISVEHQHHLVAGGSLEQPL